MNEMIQHNAPMIELPTPKICSEPLAMHPFEESRLGTRPFHVVAYAFRKGSTCAHCGRPIAHVYVISDKNGARFEVGSTCVMNTQDVVLQNDLKRHRCMRLKDVQRHTEEPELEAVLW